LFAAGGSILYYTAIAAYAGYLAKKVGATKIGMVAYDINASSAPCNAAAEGFARAGLTVAYKTINQSYPGTTVGTSIQAMKTKGVNFILSCMTGTGNVTMAKSVHSLNMKATQLWLDGGTQTVVSKYPTLMQTVYLLETHVPLNATPKKYPVVSTFKTAMDAAGEAKFLNNNLALLGWQSASLLAAGINAVAKSGEKMTSANLIKETNSTLTTFTAGGMIAPTNWQTAHTTALGPYCTVYQKVTGTGYKTVFTSPTSVFVCFARPTSTTPSKGKPETPGYKGATYATTPVAAIAKSSS
jgi:ABC-type branched-subunit amino acid transport system substrate-binding protein